MKLTTQDCLDAGLCSRGQMRFCRLHQIDFRAFVKNGIDTTELAGIDDLNLTRAIELARAREEAERQ